MFHTSKWKMTEKCLGVSPVSIVTTQMKCREESVFPDYRLVDCSLEIYEMHRNVSHASDKNESIIKGKESTNEWTYIVFLESDSEEIRIVVSWHLKTQADIHSGSRGALFQKFIVNYWAEAGAELKSPEEGY